MNTTPDWRTGPPKRKCSACMTPLTTCEAKKMFGPRSCCLRCDHPVVEGGAAV